MKLISFNKVFQAIKIYKEIRNNIKFVKNVNKWTWYFPFDVLIYDIFCLSWAKTWTLPALPVASDPLGKVAENRFNCFVFLHNSVQSAPKIGVKI